MPRGLPPQDLMQPPSHTVDELTANRSLLDITSGVQRDPQYPDPIGEGAGGNVYRGTYCWEDTTTGTPRTQTLNVVIKVLLGTKYEKEKIERRLNREIVIWSSLKHPNVVKLLGTAQLNPELPPGLVSPWVQRSDFLQYIGRHPELKRKKAREIALGLQYLHELDAFDDDDGHRGIVHGDLKVDNILISDQGVAQITDFGIARILDVKGFTTMTSRNVRYAAPELRPLTDVSLEEIRPTTASDIFSLGILLLQLFHGPDPEVQRGRPYNHIRYNPTNGDYGLLRRIHRGERPLRKNYNFIQDQHWTLIERCWAANPAERPGIAEVRQNL